MISALIFCAIVLGVFIFVEHGLREQDREAKARSEASLAAVKALGEGTHGRAKRERD